MANKTAHIILRRWKNHSSIASSIPNNYDPIEVVVGRDRLETAQETVKRIDELERDPANKLFEFNDFEIPIRFVGE